MTILADRRERQAAISHERLDARRWDRHRAQECEFPICSILAYNQEQILRWPLFEMNKHLAQHLS
jgi:limonene-1,2-epoxide hydrolase